MESTDASLPLPNTLTQCHQVINDLLDSLHKYQHTISALEHRLDLLLRSRYGRHSEQIDPEELLPALRDLYEPKEEETTSAAPVPTQKITYERKVRGHGRNEIPAHLPRQQKIYDLEESEKVCSCCGEPLQRIGEEKTEQLNYQPASLYVTEHIRYKYACRHCQETIVTADKNTYEPIEKGLAGAGLLAQVVVSKYSDHCPLYRMEDIFSREGVKIARSTMCDWMAQSAALLQPLYDLMKQRVLASKVIHTDDTPVRVQDKDSNQTRQGRLWIYRGDNNHPYNVYDYTPSRARAGPDEFLNGFTGYLQADAFGGYDGIYLTKPVIEVLCNAHARRKFYEARQVDPLLSHTALAYYKRLYAIEREVKECSAAEKYQARQERSLPIFGEFRPWLESITEAQALPKSPIRQAIHYCLGNWEALVRYTEDGDLSIDNNAGEHLMRPIGLGRKNWLFFGSDKGGRTAAVLFTMTQSAKRHRLNLFAYLNDVLERLPGIPVSRLLELLPDQWLLYRTPSEK